MIDDRTRQQIAETVSQELRTIMMGYQEEWVTEGELRKRIQMFTPGFMKFNGKFLPQAKAIYEDNNGRHETRTVYGLHAIQQMIKNNDLDFTRKDRVVYRASKGRKAGKKKMRE